jgi:DNA transposition AAA+ family ATPase
MTRINTYRLRVQSCLLTVMDAHRMIGEEYADTGFLEQFEELRKNLETLDMGFVSEGDILLVERATNALLREFETLYRRCGLGPVYQGTKS